MSIKPNTRGNHDIDINDCIIGHAEKPLRSAKEGGYGVNYPSEEGEHMRMILLKDAYSVRYRNARFFGERIRPVYISSIGGSRHLSKQAAEADRAHGEWHCGQRASPENRTRTDNGSLYLRAATAG